VQGSIRHLRALFVTLHVMAVVLNALPNPEGYMNRGLLKRRVVQKELKEWAKWTEPLTGSSDPSLFEEGLWTRMVSYQKVRKTALMPFGPYYRYFGADQHWRLFSAPNPNPAAFHIDIRTGGEWSPLYRPNSPESWRADTLGSTRFRSVLYKYGMALYPKTYGQLCRWIADEAAGDHPQAESLRFRWWKRRTPSPLDRSRGKEREGAYVREMVLPLRGPQ
jgi:hypothetical protein